MEKLIKQTTAYKIFAGDRRGGTLSHAYMLRFRDGKNLRAALKLFAAEFFGAEKDTALYNRIMHESLTDLTIYPEEGKKISVDGVSALIGDSALKPVELGKKLYIICGFDDASPLVQNKLLKTLEEPLGGIHFLLGVTSSAPVLETVLSRVKMLDIPPFTDAQIYDALERQGHNELNAAAAESSGGVLGDAENIINGGWFKEVYDAATEICGVMRVADIAAVAQKYGDTKHKKELIAEMQRQYFTALTKGTGSGAKHAKPALLYAVEGCAEANADIKFNAYFQGLLYEFMLGVILCDEKQHNYT